MRFKLDALKFKIIALEISFSSSFFFLRHSFHQPLTSISNLLQCSREKSPTLLISDVQTASPDEQCLCCHEHGDAVFIGIFFGCK